MKALLKKSGWRRAPWLLPAAALLLAAGCESTPIDESGIVNNEQLSVSGRIQLDRDRDASGVYIWLEGTHLFTYTDAEGFFSLRLPNNDAAAVGGVGGLFHLYYFVADYQLARSDILLQGGRILYRRGDVDQNGRIVRPKQLLKLVEIETTVTPADVAQDYSGPLNVTVSLQATGDSVVVIFPKTVGGQLGAVLLHHFASDTVIAQVSDVDIQRSLQVKIGRERLQWQLQIPFAPTQLPVGQYEVIPYLWIEQPDLPEDLLLSLGENVRGFGRNYLKVPFKRKGGRFEVHLNR